MIIGYCRISCIKAEDNKVIKNESLNNSISNQIRIIKDYIIREYGYDKLNDVEIIKDVGYTGTNLSRPGINKIIEKINMGGVEVVIVKDISRFMRNYIEFGKLLELFIRCNVKLISVQEGDYTNTLTNDELYMFKDMKGLLADFYSKDISIKVKSALNARKEKGIYAVGLVPFGYEKIDGKLIIIREEKEVIEQIYNVFNDKESIQQVKYYLDKKEVLTPTEFRIRRKNVLNKFSINDNEKRRWNYSTIKKILTNEFYVGNFVYNKTLRCSWEGKKRVFTNENKIITNHHEAIIDNDLYKRVQTKLQLNNRISNNR